MCFVIAVLLGVFAFNLFTAGHTAAALLCAAGAVGFIALMIRNILKTKRDREQHDH
jgi:hypothetical protein